VGPACCGLIDTTLWMGGTYPSSSVRVSADAFFLLIQRRTKRRRRHFGLFNRAFVLASSTDEVVAKTISFVSNFSNWAGCLSPSIRVLPNF
jgi:hypothetical protein